MSMMGHGGFRGFRSMRNSREILAHELKAGTIPRVWAFARAYRPMLLIFLIAVVLDAVVTTVSPLLLRIIIDSGMLGHAPIAHRRALIIWLALAVGFLALADAGLSMYQRRVSAVVGEGLIYDMRARVFAHIQSMPIAFFSRTQTGALISRLNNDVIGAQQAFTDLLSNVVGNFVMVVGVIALMFWLSWPITLVALILLPVFLVPARYVGRRLGGLYQRGLELNAEMNAVMSERFNVAGAMVVKLFGSPQREVGQFNVRAAGVRNIGVDQALYQRSLFVSLSLTASLATAFAYGFGGVAALDGTLQIGTVVALTLYLTRLYQPLTQLSNVNLDVMTALVSFERVFEVLDLEPMVKERENPLVVPPGPCAVAFDHVSFTYPGAEEVSLASLEAVAVLEANARTDVLFDVSFEVQPGTMTALVGPSGAGKTTMAMLVSRLYDVTSGAVRLNGVDVRDLSFAALSDTVGAVTQDAHLFHNSIRANLCYARPDATDAQINAALEFAQVLELVRSLPNGLETVVGERGYRLSGGEKQRIALARLLLKSPRVVVLDEATAHLDAENEAAVQRALDTTMRSRTSIVIAHRLSTIRDANEILVVDGGRIVDRGTHEQLMGRGGLYRDLYETQFGRAPAR
jgi:ATP-binding cassette, subfamily B, bacterial